MSRTNAESGDPGDGTMTSGLRATVERGVAYLKQIQLERGEFETYWSYSKDMSDPNFVSSPFITALILDFLEGIEGYASLEEIEGAPQGEKSGGSGKLESAIGEIRKKALNYLLDIRPENGFYGFFEQGIDADLDDTCLINLMLQRGGITSPDYRSLAVRVRSRALPDGRFHTWIRPNPDDPNDLDSCVGANVIRFLSHNGVPTDLTWLREDLHHWGAGKDTLYYVQPYTLPYFVSQLPLSILRTLGVNGPGMISKIESIGHIDVLDAALRLIIATKFEVDIRLVNVLTRKIIEQQDGDGAWPSRGAFQAFNYWGAESLTTAACIRALSEVAIRRKKGQ